MVAGYIFQKRPREQLVLNWGLTPSKHSQRRWLSGDVWSCWPAPSLGCVYCAALLDNVHLYYYYSTSIPAQAIRQYGVLMFSLPTQATRMGWCCLFVLTGDCISLFGDMQLEAEWIVQLNFEYSLLLLENTRNTIEKQPTSKICSRISNSGESVPLVVSFRSASSC